MIAEVETYLRSYLSFPDGKYFLPLALFAALTHSWDECFDEVPYLSVGAAVKSAGKTRVLELLSSLAGEERAILLDGSITEAALYAEIAQGKTILIDESERLRTPRSPLRPVRVPQDWRPERQVPDLLPQGLQPPRGRLRLAAGPLHPRADAVDHGGDRKEYCRAAAQQEGSAISIRLQETISARLQHVRAVYQHVHELYRRLGFLRDRDREIWLPLFSLCEVIAPSRILELERSAADIAALKTAPARPFEVLAEEERESEEAEYAERLLADAISVMAGVEKMATTELAHRLRELPSAPWRTYRGTGITDDASGAMMLASLLERFGVEPKTIRLKPKGEPNSTAKGYTLPDLVAGSERAGLGLCGSAGRNPVTLTSTAEVASGSGELEYDLRGDEMRDDRPTGSQPDYTLDEEGRWEAAQACAPSGCDAGVTTSGSGE